LTTNDSGAEKASVSDPSTSERPGKRPLLSPAVGDRALGAYFGLAVGDALGATVEFLTAREIAARYGVHRHIVGGGWLRLRPGRVTDDTEMALALGGALIASGGWNLRAIADAFTAWLRSDPVDVGNTCRRGITHYICTGELSVPPSPDAAGNGAAMRNLPTVLAGLDNEALLVQRSLEQAHLTHHHPQSDVAIATLARMTRLLVLEGGQATCNQLANDLVAQHPEFRFRPWRGRCGGYIVETLQTVFDAFFNTGSFEDCVVRAVNRGGDADTTGALAGQLAGALYGLEGIPERWLKKLDSRVTAAIYEQTMQLLTLSAQ
jgi:ADP-ribosyl-[dinitrogen reductase] hydrolase